MTSSAKFSGSSARQRAACSVWIFDITTAPVQLELPLALTERHRAASLDDGQVGLQEGVADRALQREPGVEIGCAEVVEEDAAHAPLLLAVLEKEILVAPLLEARIQVGPEGLERSLAGGMEMHGIVVEAVIRREIHATAEPADLLVRARKRGQHAYVHVDRGYVRIARMEHQRHTQCLERCTGEFGPVLRRRWRQCLAAHMREAATRAFEHLALLQDPGQAVALQRLGRLLAPGIVEERRAVDGGNRRADALLQVQQVPAHRRHALQRRQARLSGHHGAPRVGHDARGRAQAAR